ncbi:MAG: peptidylprolyl isomerase [Halieaceae bacterium]
MPFRPRDNGDELGSVVTFVTINSDSKIPIMLKFLAKASSCFFASLVLTGCFHTQLNGSVGGASVTVATLRSPDLILGTATSLRPAELIDLFGDETWAEWPSLARMLFVGITQFKVAQLDLDPDSLYVVTATGGDDYDPDSRLALSENPVGVQGNWHVIATGQRIIDGNLKVSALTESIYRQQLPILATQTDIQVQSRLEAAAKLLVADVDNSGSVDYDDVLRWNRSLDSDFLLGSVPAVDALSDAITAGQPTDILAELASDVLGGHQVELLFDNGQVVVETYNWESPVTAANFLEYVRDQFYDQVLVHRAINDFMVQVGLLSYDGANESGQISYSLKPSGTPIINESNNGLSNVRGALAMARTSDPNSASTQFFINQANNQFLDFGSSGNPDGYAVFARVLSGLSVVDEIAAEPTVSVSGIGSDVPARGVVLESAKIL